MQNLYRPLKAACQSLIRKENLDKKVNVPDRNAGLFKAGLVGNLNSDIKALKANSFVKILFVNNLMVGCSKNIPNPPFL